MSSSSVQPDSRRRLFKFRSLLILSLVAGYPLVSYWIFLHGGRIGTTALWVAALPQVFCYLVLFWFFGRTLVSGREALLTRFARFIHGEITPDIVAYTRQITLLWCVFFGAMVMLSTMFLLFVSTEAWLFFANVLNLPIVVCVFVAEYVYRVARFPKGTYPSLAATIDAFQRFRQTSKEDSRRDP